MIPFTQLLRSNNSDARLEAVGFPLDQLPPEGQLFESMVVSGNLIYVSGQVPFLGDELAFVGSVPSQVSEEDATNAAALCAANALRLVRARLGTLAKVDQVLRITGYVRSDPDFTNQHLVINGASKLVRDVFGERGRHARTALGMAQLPLGVSVELEMILQI